MEKLTVPSAASTALKRIAMWVLATAALAPVFAQATPINGTFAFNQFGNASLVGGTSFATAASVNFASLNLVTGTGGATYLGSPNEFSSLLMSTVAVVPTLTLTGIGSTLTPVSITNFFDFGPIISGTTRRFEFDLTDLMRTPGGFQGYLNGKGILIDNSGVLSPNFATFSLGSSGSGYNLNYGVSFATVPVPEPETYAMLMAGLGLMGFVAYRRKQGAV